MTGKGESGVPLGLEYRPATPTKYPRGTDDSSHQTADLKSRLYVALQLLIHGMRGLHVPFTQTTMTGTFGGQCIVAMTKRPR